MCTFPDTGQRCLQLSCSSPSQALLHRCALIQGSLCFICAEMTHGTDFPWPARSGLDGGEQHGAARLPSVHPVPQAWGPPGAAQPGGASRFSHSPRGHTSWGAKCHPLPGGSMAGALLKPWMLVGSCPALSPSGRELPKAVSPALLHGESNWAIAAAQDWLCGIGSS